MNWRVLGVDPGLAQTGWGLVDSDGNRHKHVDHGTIATNSGEPPELRLLTLHREMSAIISAFKPMAVGAEKLYFARNVSSAMPVAQARGAVLLTAALHGLRVEEFTPNTIKESVVGTGSADKSQIGKMIMLLLGLTEAPDTDHAADALAVAITFIHREAVSELYGAR
ncbi:MAG: crossover junction endodeoxyribonuclease RuvC [Spirochaeta sp. LUC14_002_19_P3]|nr:MAG: crossover junction endodeoxyribonuclease RuvC [Spirochaeta sp. LUC14_002_19_P3]